MINPEINQGESMIKEEADLGIRRLKLRNCVDMFIDSLVGSVFFFPAEAHEEAFREVLSGEMMGIFVNLLYREEELSRKANQAKISHLRLVKEAMGE